MKIVLLFPGYGSQFVGMGKELYDEHRIIQEYFEEASNCLDINFVKLCFASSEAELGKINNAYTSTFLVSSAIVALLKQELIQADAVAGFNQGEYAALLAANGISLPDGLYLLNKYAHIYREAAEVMQVSAIHIRGIDTSKLEDICFKVNSSDDDERAFVGIYTTDNDHVVTGNTRAVQLVRDMVSSLSDKQAVEIELTSVDVGLHSPLMIPVVDQLKMYLEKVDFKDLTMPMIDSSHGTKMQEGVRIREHILAHIRSAVMWPKVSQQLADYDVIVQVGPGDQLSSLAKKYYPDKHILAINKPGDVEALKKLMLEQEQASDNEDRSKTDLDN